MGVEELRAAVGKAGLEFRVLGWKKGLGLRVCRVSDEGFVPL